jgi:hypothetical protein
VQVHKALNICRELHPEMLFIMQHDNQDSVPILSTVSEGFAQWCALGNKRRYTHGDHLRTETGL